MEFLSAQLNTTSQPVNLVLQSSQSEAAGYDAANTRTYKVHQLSFIPSNGFHEYRFDWLSGSVKFFADGILLDTMEQAVPTSPGHITLSHWSTGNPNWSAGPPTTDAILTIQYLKGYFNSSDPTRQRDWAKRCMDVSAPNATCAIPDITEAPNGNVSAKTFFFSMQANETANRTVSGTRRTNQGRALEPLEAGKVASTVALLVGMACIMTWGW